MEELKRAISIFSQLPDPTMLGYTNIDIETEDGQSGVICFDPDGKEVYLEIQKTKDWKRNFILMALKLNESLLRTEPFGTSIGYTPDGKEFYRGPAGKFLDVANQNYQDYLESKLQYLASINSEFDVETESGDSGYIGYSPEG